MAAFGLVQVNDHAGGLGVEPLVSSCPRDGEAELRERERERAGRDFAVKRVLRRARLGVVNSLETGSWSTEDAPIDGDPAPRLVPSRLRGEWHASAQSMRCRSITSITSEGPSGHGPKPNGEAKPPRCTSYVPQPSIRTANPGSGSWRRCPWSPAWRRGCRCRAPEPDRTAVLPSVPSQYQPLPADRERRPGPSCRRP